MSGVQGEDRFIVVAREEVCAVQPRPLALAPERPASSVWGLERRGLWCVVRGLRFGV